MYAVVKGLFTGILVVREVVSMTEKTITMRNVGETHAYRRKRDHHVVAIFESREAAEKAIADARRTWDSQIKALTVDRDLAEANLQAAKNRKLEMVREAAGNA